MSLTIIEIEIRIKEIESIFKNVDYSWIKTNPNAVKLQEEIQFLDVLLERLKN